MNKKQNLGKQGEFIAQKYLESINYKIIETNYRCKFGEADIIATKNNEIAFVEVKTRSQEKYGTPAEAVTLAKKRHIYNVAEYYLFNIDKDKINISLDIIEVYMQRNSKPRINFLKNAILEK